MNINTIKTFFVSAFKAFVRARQAQANRRIAEMHLNNMSDKELRDIGITRGEIKIRVRNA
jgi:uncharacterized protein YjiS (DUF1127 family)